MERSKYADKRPKHSRRKTACAPRVAVMGIGNLLLKDEGIGIHVIQKLRDTVDSTVVEIIDAGTAPDIFSLVPQNIDKLIIIDSAAGNDKPGTVYYLDRTEIAPSPSAPISLHNIGLAENMKMLSLLNPNLKSVIIIGIQAGDISFGMEPTSEVQEKIPQVIQMVLTEIQKKD